jgi:DNA modification methylase
MNAENQLFYGDNLDILKLHIDDDSVDLIYLDPPFKSNKDYNILFDERNGTQSKAQIKAFEDTWSWDQGAAEAYQNVVEGDEQDVSRAMQAFRTYLGETDMMAYLAMMAPRLIEMKRVLTKTGSIYLHCDPTASHYLKMLMDSVFGPKNFRNEIIWHYRRWTGEASRFQQMHDVILFYAKDFKNVIFNQLYTPYTKKSAKRKEHYHTRIKGDDVYVTSVDPKGVRENDVWSISVINPAAKERLGYPTQKPEALLKRIVLASTKKGDIVLDPFCGCGTTIVVAQKLQRDWIGIDITHIAIALIKHRLDDIFGGKVEFKTIGEPVTISGAQELAQENHYQFQLWALGLLKARPSELKKGADKGIDGRKYFHDGTEGTKQIIFSVKSGHVTVSHLRDLRGVIERENAQIGVFVTMRNPTKPMRTEAASSGFYKSPWGKHPAIQILTIQEILNGKSIDFPRNEGVDKTFKKARRVRLKKAETQELNFD